MWLAGYKLLKFNEMAPRITQLLRMYKKKNIVRKYLFKSKYSVLKYSKKLRGKFLNIFHKRFSIFLLLKNEVFVYAECYFVML